MILPFIHIEAMAAEAYLLEPEGTDRDAFLLGFVAGAEAMGRALRGDRVGAAYSTALGL